MADIVLDNLGRPIEQGGAVYVAGKPARVEALNVAKGRIRINGAWVAGRVVTVLRTRVEQEKFDARETERVCEAAIRAVHRLVRRHGL